MNKYFKLIVCMTAIMALSSCSFFEEEKSQSNQQEKSSTIEGLPQGKNNKIATQDLLMNELVSKVDSLTKQTQQENDILKTDVEEFKKMVLIGFVFVLIFLIIMSCFRAKEVNEDKVKELIEKCIKDSNWIKTIQNEYLMNTQRNSRTNQSNTSYASNTGSRMNNLGNQMSQVSATINNKMTPSTQPMTQPDSDTQKPHKSAEYPKVGYAKNDMDKYFTKIYDSNQEECVFKITFTDPNMGRFNIISLDKIRSRNDWQQKIICSGISINDASDFQVEEEGVCKKIDDKTWIVEKPLKIRLQ